MSWRDRPNASSICARYAERKREAARARDAAAGPSPCNKCPELRTAGSIFCVAHKAEYGEILERMARGEVDPLAAVAFCDRTYWPPAPKRT